ncbi:MAG: Copper binding protein plastocyanin/azurin family [Thermoleophilaceae bacterium]|jgi:plastocyanin|nr:Copper binding protein plastocyanin/azurin family [Thermoleophilaceae bacterium]
MPRRIPLLALAGAAVSLATPSVAAADTARVGAYDNYWSPHKVEINVGDKVRWLNREGTHSIVMKSGGQDVDSVFSGDASVKSDRFRDAGTYRFICRFHIAEGMKGKVVVDQPSGGKD